MPHTFSDTRHSTFGRGARRGDAPKAKGRMNRGKDPAIRKDDGPVNEGAHQSDAATRQLHGSGDPVKFQRIYVDPHVIRRHCRDAIWEEHGDAFNDHPSVRLPGDWDQKAVDIDTVETGPIIAAVARKLREELSWEQVGEIERRRAELRRVGMVSTEWKISNRYKLLDRIIADVRATGRLRSEEEVSRQPFRERGGIGVAIGRDGTVLKSRNGNHRLAIALYFRLAAIPVAVEAVHPDCLENGKWKEILDESRRLEKKVNGQAEEDGRQTTMRPPRSAAATHAGAAQC